jgi:uncharacterized membrane protein
MNVSAPGSIKKYVPTSGDVITRLRKKKRLKITQLGRRQALEEHEMLTRKWEWRHLVSAVILQAWAILAGLSIGAEHFWISSAINLIVNGYPILVQRFNRARIVLCLGRMQPEKSLTRALSADASRPEGYSAERQLLIQSGRT